MSDLELTESKLWSDAELAGAVNAYLFMLKEQIEGRPANKSAMVKKLQAGGLGRRSTSSINRRMSNISSVLYDLKLPQVQGYAPLPNVGSAVKVRVIELLIAGGLNGIAPYAPTDDQTVLAERVTRLRKTGIDFVPLGAKIPRQMTTTATSYVRDPAVKAWVLQVAGGVCEGCKQLAPFAGIDGLPYLEVHHVMSLSNHGSDRISNAAALCPNCHSRCHRALDRDEFRMYLYEKIPRLEMEVPGDPIDNLAVLITDD